MGYYQGIGARRSGSRPRSPASARHHRPSSRRPTPSSAQWTPVAPAHHRRRRGRPVPTCSSWSAPPASRASCPCASATTRPSRRILVQQSVTTWQAYNRWGGYSLYYGNTGGARQLHPEPGRVAPTPTGPASSPSTVPTATTGLRGPPTSSATSSRSSSSRSSSASTSPTGPTSTSTSARLLANHRALFSLGHDEYWSAPMRTGAETARAAAASTSPSSAPTPATARSGSSPRRSGPTAMSSATSRPPRTR